MLEKFGFLKLKITGYIYIHIMTDGPPPCNQIVCGSKIAQTDMMEKYKHV
jgi:hypothetical protein